MPNKSKTFSWSKNETNSATCKQFEWIQNLIDFRRLDLKQKELSTKQNLMDGENTSKAWIKIYKLLQFGKRVNYLKNRKQQNYLPINSKASWIEDLHP